MVLFSTPKSLENGEISFLAITEIILAVAIYWGIAIYYEIYWHIIASIIITPIFLFRSQESTTLALKWFNDISNRKCSSDVDNHIYYNLMIAIGYLSYFIASWSIEKNIDFITLNIKIFWLGFFLLWFTFGILALIGRLKDGSKVQMLLRVSILIGLFISNGQEAMLGALLGTGLGMATSEGGGHGFLATVTNFITSMIKIKYGYKNILFNWKYNNFIVDLKKIPEIIPDIEKYEGLEIFKLSNIGDTYSKYTNGFFAKKSAIFFYIPITIFAFFYRLSIKSTFWFYLPLLFLVQKPNLTTSSNISKFLSELYQTILAIITIIAFVITHFNGIDYIFNHTETSPISSFIIAFYIDFSSIEIWRIFQLIVASLTIILFLYANKERVIFVENNIPLTNNSSIKTIFYLNSLRNWISFFYFFSAFVFIANQFKIWEYKYIPNFFYDFFTIILNGIEYTPFG